MYLWVFEVYHNMLINFFFVVLKKIPYILCLKYVVFILIDDN